MQQYSSSAGIWSIYLLVIRYSKACGSYRDFLDRGLLLRGKLLNHGFLLVKLKSLLRKYYGRHHDTVDRYGISVTNDHGYVPRKYFLVLSSFTTYHRMCNQINMTGVTSGAGTVYPFGAPEFTSGFLEGFVLLDLQFYVYVLQIVVCHFILVPLSIVLIY